MFANLPQQTNVWFKCFMLEAPIESVKLYVVEEISKSESKLRVLICTIALGWGQIVKMCTEVSTSALQTQSKLLFRKLVDLVEMVNNCNVFHTFYTKTIVLYLTNCDGHVRVLVEASSCRQVFISRLFEASGQAKSEGCLCCNVCSKVWKCLDYDSMVMISFSPIGINKQNGLKRQISKMQIELIHEKLLNYRASILPKRTNEFLPVGSTNVLFEFDHYQIKQVLEKCCYVYTIDDLLEYVELWRNTHTNNIMAILAEIFDDIDANCDRLDSDNEEMDIEEDD